MIICVEGDAGKSQEAERPDDGHRQREQAKRHVREVAVGNRQEKRMNSTAAGTVRMSESPTTFENSSATIPLPNRVMPPWSALETVNPAVSGCSLADSNRPGLTRRRFPPGPRV